MDAARSSAAAEVAPDTDAPSSSPADSTRPPDGGATDGLAAEAPRRRDPVIDSLRGYGLMAVVLQHAVGFPASIGDPVALALLGAALWAVPALFATSGYLSALRPGRISLARRFRRLLVPYVVWSVVLFAYINRGALMSGSLPKLGVTGWLGVVFAGQAYYTLWFLAMLVYATLAGWALTTNRARLAGALPASPPGGRHGRALGTPAESQQTWVGFITFAPVCIGLYLLGAMLATLRDRVDGSARSRRWRGSAWASRSTPACWSRSGPA